MNRLTSLACAALYLVPVAHAEDISGKDAQLAFNNHCRQCHSTDEGDHRLGPSLHGVVGRDAGSLEGYQYSSALESSGIAWDADQLEKWIEDPNSVMSGHKMKPYPGVADADMRKKIIAHLENTGS